MEIGIFARTFPRPDLDATLKAVMQYGLRSVHFNLTCVGMEPLPLRIEDSLCRTIREAFERYHLKMIGVSGTFNAIHPDRERRKEMTRRCCELIRRAPEMGTDLVTLCTGSRDRENKWHRHEENASPEAWNDLIVTLEQLIPVAEKARVILGIEPETANVVHSAEKARRLLDQLRSDHLKIIMDAANLFTPETLSRMQTVLKEAFDLLGTDIVSVHAKDVRNDSAKTSHAAGTGSLDYDTYFRLIRRSEYDGPIVLHNLEESQIDQTVAFVKRHINNFVSASEYTFNTHHDRNF